MKKIVFFLLLSAFVTSVQAQTYTVNAASSAIVWKGYKVTGEHTGTVKIKDGKLSFSNGVLNGGEFTIDMNSINNTDLEGEWTGRTP